MVRFAEIRQRVTGFSIPVFGVSWNPGEAEVTVARRVITFLEDRRVLFNPYELEDPRHCALSVIEIRQFLTGELAGLGDDDDLAPHLVAMRAACRKFLDTVQAAGGGDRLMHPGNMWGSEAWVFNAAMGELRGAVGMHVAQVAAKFGLDVEDGLASTLPAEPDDDDGDEDRFGFWR